MLEQLKEKFSDMAETLKVGGFREWVNQNSAVVTVAAVVVLVLSLAIIINQGRGRSAPKPGNAYFYDVVTKEYFTDSATKIPPITSPAGNEAVRAHFFTCGECTEKTSDEGGERFVGYYEKYLPDIKAKLEKNPEAFEFYEEAFQGRLYSPDGTKWTQAESPTGFKLIEDLQTKCPAKKLRYCPPK